MENEIEIRECVHFDELADCVRLQREVFALPDLEISPVRHLIVAKNAGGFVLGAFDGERLTGFVLSLPGFIKGRRAFYSHMTAVDAAYQSHGIGGRLKWAQRTRSLDEGVDYVKWTFEPVKARNAYFNLEKLGAAASEYQPNFYGNDYTTSAQMDKKIGLASDRLFAEWHLRSNKVESLAAGEQFFEVSEPAVRIETVDDWLSLATADAQSAKAEQMRIRREFASAFARGLAARGFDRSGERPAYLLYEK